jgi:ATP-dependent Clp protease protease subunit
VYNIHKQHKESEHMTKFLATILTALHLTSPSTATATTINLTPDNHVIFRGEVNDTSANSVLIDLLDLALKRGTKDYPIYLVMDSGGGAIDAGLGFVEVAKSIPNLQTVTIFAASMASAIVEALPGKRNIIAPGILMFHRAKGGVEGQFETGELETRLDLYKRLVRTQLEQPNADRMGMSLETYKAKVKDEMWILGSESVKAKAADEVVTVTCSKELLQAYDYQTFSIMGLFTVKVKFSKCPMLRGGEVTNKKDEEAYAKYRQSLYGLK